MRKIVLAATIAALTLATSCINNETKTTEKMADGATGATTSMTKIAYVNIDSLLSKYDLYAELQAEFSVKAKKVDGDLTARGNKLQKDVADFQEKVEKMLITRSQAAQMEEELQKRQQSIMQYSQKMQSELGEQEAVMLNNIQHNISEYLKEFNKDYRYSMIISTSAGGPIMNADPSLDITKSVLEGLNKQYAAKKTK